jgi:hypothetical protein
LAGGAALISVLIGQSCSGGTGVADSASQVAQRNIPANFLAIYESVGARYRIPWEVLAGIGEEECDHGRNPDRSCTPQPGAKGAGVANCAGASGPMQIGVGGGPCGSAGDEYDSLRGHLPDPSLGPHDPTTAVELAALERWLWWEQLWADVCALRVRYRLAVRSSWWDDPVQVEALAALAAWIGRYDSGEWDDPPGKLALLYDLERVAALLRDDGEPFHPDRDRLTFARFMIDAGCQPPPDSSRHG